MDNFGRLPSPSDRLNWQAFAFGHAIILVKLSAGVISTLIAFDLFLNHINHLDSLRELFLATPAGAIHSKFGIKQSLFYN